MKTTFKTKVLSIILCTLMLFYAIPLAGFKANSAFADTQTPFASGQAVSETDIMCEDVSLREENVKYFLRYDGTRVAAVYDTPVHYLDSDGVWQEYNNSLDESNTWLPDSLREYSPVSSDIGIKLSKKAKSNKMITFSDIGLSWGYEDTGNSTAYIATEDGNVTEYKNKDIAALAVKNASSKVVYPEIYENTDLELTVSGTGVKENIILKSPDTRRIFTISYKTDGTLTPVQKDSRTVALCDADGNVKYTVTAPYMYDAAGESSDALSLTLVESKNKKFTLTLSADSSWLSAQERTYPVVLDPAFTYKPQSASEAYETTGIYYDTVPDEFSANGENNYAKVGGKYVGGTRIEAVTLSYHTLPSQIDNTSRIIDARIYLFYYLMAIGTTCPVDLQINAYKITSEWDMTKPGEPLTRDELPTYSPSVLDYAVANENQINANDTSTYYESFDITEAAQSWLDGENNYGILLKAKELSWNDCFARFMLSRHSEETLNPAFVYNYRDTKGLESYWSYYSFAAGINGTGYVNNYSGAFVYGETLFSSTGTRNPYAVTLTYNNSLAKQKVCPDFSAGYGWMLDGQQRVDAVTDTALLAAGYDYIWTDTDGTEHYFRKKADADGIWVDEDGLGLELTLNNGVYIRSESGYELHFSMPEHGGWLYHAKDVYGNTTRYHYEKPSGFSEYVLTKIVSATGKTTTFEYTQVGSGASAYPRLEKITDPSGREYTLSYASTHYLSRITYPDATYTSFSYVGTQIRTIAARKEKIELSYTQGANGIYRVQDIKEYAWSTADGSYVLGENSVSFAYSGSNTTTITDAQGLSTKYVFDNVGRPTSVIAPDGSVASATYHKEEAGTLTNAASTSSINNNRLTGASASPAYTKNYLGNPNMEGYTGGFYAAVYNGDGSFDPCIVDSTEKYLGENSLKLSNTAGGVTWSAHRQIIADSSVLDAGYVTISAYLKTDNVAAQNTWRTSGAGVNATFYDADGNWISDVYSDTPLTGTNDWQRVSYTFEVPEGAATLKVGYHLMNATGTAWFDCAQVEAGKTMNTLNLLENSSFDGTGAWLDGNLDDTTDTLAGNGYIEMTGDRTKNKFIYQRVKVDRADVCFTFIANGWADALANASSEALLEASISYADGTAEWQKVSFNPYCASEEQQALLCVKPERAGVTVSSIGFYLIYRYNENVMRINEVMMSIDESGTTYSYDDDGNLESASDNAQRNESYTYNDVGEVTGYTDVKSDHYTYGYNENNKHQLDYMYSEDTQRGFNFSYDNWGNLTGVQAGRILTGTNTIDGADEHTSLIYGYDSLGEYLISTTDERGQTTLYDINTLTGLTNSVTVPSTVLGLDKNLITRYTYNEDNHSLLSAGLYSSDAPDTLISGVTYTYNTQLSQLKKIVRADGQTYNFVYDIWGRVTDIKVGNKTLSHSVYEKTDSNDTTLSRTEYGNGDAIYYSYDYLNRIIAQSTSEGGTPYVSYDYNNEGLVARQNDSLADVASEYQYDLLGRLTASTRSQGDIGRYSYTYDASNNLTGMHAYLSPYSDWNLNIRYYYGDDNLQTMSEQGNYLVYYTYDALGRISEVKAVEVTDGAEFYTCYEHLTSSETGNSTSLISKVTYKKKANGGTLATVGSIEYTYDRNGFISSVTVKDANGTVTDTESYTYDALGQLSTVAKGNSLTEYTYDNSGNILTKKVNGTVVGSYTYGDSQWKDLLTAYNGQSITYDGIGNPTSYIGWDNLTWSMGRRLTALSNDNTNITYNYDAAGQRISKTVNGVTTEFYYDDRGALVLSSSSNGTDIYFYPDADGSIGSIGYNGNRYYYVSNAQNDIIGITDKTGAFVARYTYDEWGNITSITDGAGNDVSGNAAHIANLNPFRYRSYFYDAETGWYWLNTRYYDPAIGRFINADVVISDADGDIKGYNLFAYCFNNPVNMEDSTGNWPQLFKKAVKWVAKNIVKPVVKKVEEVLSKVDLTYSTGINISGTPSASIFNGQIGVSVDTKGNVAIQASAGGGLTGGTPSLSISTYNSITNAPSIEQLNGEGYQLGGSVIVPVEGVPVAVGGDLNIIPDKENNKTYYGITLTKGVALGSPGGEVHAEWGTTTTLPKTTFNIFDVARSVYIKIMEW